MFLPVWYMMTLVEFFGPFATTRNQSEWVKPYMATDVAAMLWSRITALNSAQNLINTNPRPLHLPQRQDDQGKAVSFEEIGLIYPVEDSVVYIRPTLRKSPWLYGVLAVQPLLTVVMLGVTFLFYSTPIDKGFGLPAILSGIESGSLDSLKGAALSGKLTKDVKLIICPSPEGHQGTIDYRIEHASSTHRNERLSRNIIYY
ncbi:hypothetical protein LTR70_004833 [Exophiala xenobiotica]|uniref:Uncharacterized protein n=1 Tax=Lithohypha guttulata TaxID=1690604 RepID=A0ABR0KBR7_9EURO|nr:hypothetical protein LTR24_004451 [Lithohypha guttulata]KAK5319789.1 hypothetical protein LTR70_004833 [Exophiala xenobiotica]